MKKTNLILLTETERAMVEESLYQCHQNYFLGSANWVSAKSREKTRPLFKQTLEIIKSFSGGIRKPIKAEQLDFICSSLHWYSGFFSRKNKNNATKYNELSVILDQRDKQSYLFDFDPTNYNHKDSQPIQKKDFSKLRFLIARETPKGIDYVTEFHRLDNESDEKYKIRAKKESEKQQNHTGKFIVITETDLQSIKVSDSCHYYNRND